MPTPHDPSLTPPGDGASGSDSIPPSPRGRTPRPSHAVFWWALLIVVIIAVAGAAWWESLKRQEYGPPLPDLGAVPAFALTNEKNTSVTLEQLKGRVWVADFIFTRCGGQCPLMTNNMRSLQKWLEKKQMGNVKLVSISVDPENDTPPILQKYANTFKADTSQWSFLTGDRTKIYGLITNGFKLGVDENKGKPVTDMFVHSDKFVVVDRDGRIRGYYSGTDTDPKETEKLHEALIRLSHEPDAAVEKAMQK